MSQGEHVFAELDSASVEASHARPAPGTSDAASATATATTVQNQSTGSIASASPPAQQLDAHVPPQTTCSSVQQVVVRNKRPAVDSGAAGAVATPEAASVALMLCELKTTTTM
jgi:hypothetical protein